MKVDRIVAVLNDKIVYKNGNSCIKTFGRDYPKIKVIEEALCYGAEGVCGAGAVVIESADKKNTFHTKVKLQFHF